MVYRLDTPSAVSTPPEVGPIGEEGFPAIPNPPSVMPSTIDPYWHYSLCEEIRNVVVAAQLTPTKGNVAQLLAAIQKLIGGTLTIGSNYYILKTLCPGSPSGFLYEVGGVATLPASGNPTASVIVTLPITFNGILYGWPLASAYGDANGTEGALVAPQCVALSNSQIKIDADTLSGGSDTFNETVACTYVVKGY